MDRRKAIVREAYDAVADTWGRERESTHDAREHQWLDRFCTLLQGSRVLDLGCGGGAISSRLVARGLHLTGVDLSRAQLKRARVACPSLPLVQADLAEVEFAPASFDGVIAYDSLWHVPREEHGAALARMRRWVAAGAMLLMTVAALDATQPDEELVDPRLCGAPIYYSGWPRATTFDLLRAARFELVDFDDSPMRAMIVLARAV